MTNSKLSALLLALAVLAPAAAPARAATALQQLGREAGVDAAPLASRMTSLRALAAAETPLMVPMIPRHGKDVLVGCSALEVRSLMIPNAKQAALLIQTCLNHAYAADGDYTVTASAARFGARVCPEKAGAMSCQAIEEVVGIKITVSGVILDGDPVLLDLAATLAGRNGLLLGFRAVLDNEAEIRN
jgi:hypothetical protein